MKTRICLGPCKSTYPESRDYFNEISRGQFRDICKDCILAEIREANKAEKERLRLVKPKYWCDCKASKPGTFHEVEVTNEGLCANPWCGHFAVKQKFQPISSHFADSSPYDDEDHDYEVHLADGPSFHDNRRKLLEDQ